jgi:predicted metalloprotease with PDZ domain
MPPDAGEQQRFDVRSTIGNRSPSLLALIASLCVAFACMRQVIAERALSTSSPDLDYVFTLGEGVPRSVRVGATSLGDKSGRTVFSVNADWGGVEEIGKEFVDVAVRTQGGRSLPVAHSNDHQWAVEHAPNEKLTVEYTLVQAPGRKPRDGGNEYRPIISDNLFHLIGNNGLLRPEHLQGDDDRAIRFAWKGFVEAGWKVVSSHGTGAEPITVRMPLDEFLHALFLAGDVRIHERSLNGTRIGVAIHGDRWKFKDDAFVDLAARVIKIERDFFNDWSDPWYLISLIPSGPDDPNSLSMGGTGLTNCFALFMSPGAGLEHDSPGKQQIERLLTHEYFHRWNGGRVDFEEPEAQIYWMTEGFTDFYARRLMFRDGFYTPAEYVEDWNDSLRDYFVSPVREASNLRIIEEFWKNPDIQTLPYRRGDVLALLLDYQIARSSGGKRSLDDFVRDLFARTPAGRHKLDNQKLFDRIAQWTDAAFAETVRGYVVDGKTIELPPDIGEPMMTLKRRMTGRFDPGFDLNATQVERRMVGVREGSSGHKAGLRDGQKLLGMSVHVGNAGQPAELTIEENGERREIKYAPTGGELEAPYFELKQRG